MLYPLTRATPNSDYGLLGDKTATANLEGNIVSVLQAGCFFGAIAAFPLTDMFGRKWCLVVAAFLTLVGVAMQAAASGNLGPVYAGRAIAGMSDPLLRLFGFRIPDSPIELL